MAASENYLNHRQDRVFKVDDRERVGLGGFNMLVHIEQDISLSSSIPEAHLETGEDVNDHIIRDKKKLTFKGEAADIYLRTQNDPAVAKRFAQNLIPPEYSRLTVFQNSILRDQILQASSIINSIENINDAILNVFSYTQSQPIQNQFFDFMERLHDTNQIIDIETPFKVYRDMRITSVTIRRNVKSSSKIFYTISAEEFRFAEVPTTNIQSRMRNPNNTVAKQAEAETDKGTVEPEETDRSLLSTVFGRILS